MSATNLTNSYHTTIIYGLKEGTEYEFRVAPFRTFGTLLNSGTPSLSIHYRTGIAYCVFDTPRKNYNNYDLKFACEL